MKLVQKNLLFPTPNNTKSLNGLKRIAS